MQIELHTAGQCCLDPVNFQNILNISLQEERKLKYVFAISRENKMPLYTNISNIIITSELFRVAVSHLTGSTQGETILWAKLTYWYNKYNSNQTINDKEIKQKIQYI